MSLISIYTGGILTILLAILHTRFYKQFEWGIEFGKISRLNNKIFYTIHLALTILFFLMGILILIYADELSRNEGIAFGLNLIFSIFWFWRFLWQAVYFKSQKGRKKFPLSIILLVWFFVLFICFILPVIVKDF